MKEILKRNSFEISAIALFSISYVVFCNYLMIELPHMSWFDQFPLIESYYNKTLTFSQLSNAYVEHGLLGYNILFLINVIVFKLTTFFDVYINDINVILVGIISVLSVKKTLGTSQGRFYKLNVIVICSFVFNFMQLSSGGMETQVRLGILFFVIAAIMTEHILQEKVSLRYMISTIIMIFLSINIFGTFYSFAGIIAIFLIILIDIIRNKKIEKHHLAIISTYLLCACLYFFQYDLLGKGNMSSGGILTAVKGILTNPMITIKAILAYNASAILGYPVYVDKILPDNIYLVIGFIVTGIYIYALARYFKSKLYLKTKLPLLFLSYSIFVLALVVIGRYTVDWGWYVSFWYTVHTKLAAIACVWILAYDCTFGRKSQIQFTSIACIGFLFIGILFGNLVELRRVPYERAYYLEKQPYLFAENINELPTDGNGETPLLHNPVVTMHAIELMKEHNLSVYKYFGSYEKMQRMQGRNVGNTLKSAIILNGIYDDGWLGKSAEFKIQTGEEGKVSLTGYYPNEITGKETGTIFIDGEPNPFKIAEPNFTLDLPAKAESIVTVKIENDFDFQADAPDIRQLSFILSNAQGK